MNLIALGTLHNTQFINGKIYQNVAPSFEHVRAVLAIEDVFNSSFGRDYVWRESPIRAGGFPEPDIALLRVASSALKDYPTPSQVVCVVEVAISSHDFDVNTKMPAYQEAGIEAGLVVSPRPDGTLDIVAEFGAVDEVNALLTSLRL